MSDILGISDVGFQTLNFLRILKFWLSDFGSRTFPGFPISDSDFPWIRISGGGVTLHSDFGFKNSVFRFRMSDFFGISDFRFFGFRILSGFRISDFPSFRIFIIGFSKDV